MAQVLLRLPDDLAYRFRQAVPARERSAYVQKLLEQALPPKDDDWLYKVALAATADQEHDQEWRDWEVTAADGVDAEEHGLDDPDLQKWMKAAG